LSLTVHEHVSCLTIKRKVYQQFSLTFSIIILPAYLVIKVLLRLVVEIIFSSYCRINLTKQLLKYKGLLAWNGVPSIIKEIHSYQRCRSEMKKSLTKFPPYSLTNGKLISFPFVVNSKKFPSIKLIILILIKFNTGYILTASNQRVPVLNWI